MSQPTPPPAEPVVPTPAPTTAVPYGPPAGGSGDVVPTAAATIDLSKSGLGGTAGKWALRLLLPIVIRAIFRAIFR